VRNDESGTVVSEASKKQVKKAKAGAVKINEKVLREEIDADVRKLHAQSLLSNIQRAADQLAVMGAIAQKELLKGGKTGARTMRAEVERVKEIPLPPASTILSSRRREETVMGKEKVTGTAE